ncbi:MAG: hypothetical protein N4A57_00880 [Anaeromicrobium sp.]|jgi:hypothetical protein|nr:hypothetical protein [Anaeromicrobium sp.]MCT4592818.1 hypothetical protein [Anaeromicrobium sp.]
MGRSRDNKTFIKNKINAALNGAVFIFVNKKENSGLMKNKNDKWKTM